MTRVLRCLSLIGVLMLVLACGSGSPTGPIVVTEPVPPVVVPPTPEPPRPLPSGEPAATYVFHGRLDHPIYGSTAGSRYLLYDNGVFALQFDAFSHVYMGTYQQDDATITFGFDGRWAMNGGYATGTITGDLLEVRYSEIMQHSDFENAVYRRLE